MSEVGHILVVDDEPSIVRAVAGGLTARGYRVASVSLGEEAMAAAARESFDLIILDLGLPDVDGVEVCRRIRMWSSAPILVLSAEGSEERKVLALDEGANDFVTKPFSMPELLARVRVALRGREQQGGAETAVRQCGQLSVDVSRREVRLNGEPVILTRKEFDFLALLAEYPGRVLTHRFILQEVWGPDYGSEVQYLRVYASQLRKKLGDDPDNPRIATSPGVGYRLLDPESDADVEPR